jgi:hypothetical protein
MVLYLCVLIMFSLHRESLKLILVDEPLPEVILSQPDNVRLDPYNIQLAVWVSADL